MTDSRLDPKPDRVRFQVRKGKCGLTKDSLSKVQNNRQISLIKENLIISILLNIRHFKCEKSLCYTIQKCSRVSTLVVGLVLYLIKLVMFFKGTRRNIS